jgi:hypothetical protein
MSTTVSAEAETTTRIFISGLPPSVTPAALAARLSRFGAVSGVSAPPLPADMRVKGEPVIGEGSWLGCGFAHADLGGGTAALEAARKALNGTRWLGKEVRLEEARPKRGEGPPVDHVVSRLAEGWGGERQWMRTISRQCLGQIHMGFPLRDAC